LILFSKAKSLFQLIRRGSTFGAEHMLKNNLSGQGRTESKSLDLHRLREACSATEFADVDPISSDRINETVADGTLALDFQVETSAEEFFNNSHGERAKGTFHKVDVVRWEHDETDWKIEAVEFTPPANPAGKPRTQKDVRASAIRVRAIASSHGWLSPKSSRALEKLGNPKTKLDQSDVNALNYLLRRCANISEITYDVKVLLTVAN
jgi:hypothetical protein